MRRIIFLLFLLTLFSCKKQEISAIKENKDTVEYESTNWQEGFGLTHSIDLDSVWGKPVRYYITNKNLDSKALKFYLGNYRPKDEPETARLLNLVTTDNDSLRPFYRWILHKTILIQDGALGEYTGIPARKYAEKYPKEFFEYIDFDKSGKTYLDWYNSIAYSGFYDFENYKETNGIKENLVKTMNSNCGNCDETIKKRILKFADDCFSHEKPTNK
ncbi:hypothetical protein OF897_05250 [Chryseobacterium formosus]|uniref:Lipoprotein n=1 Tax=Chryseobacterium formosus TaxID=1537363 RepID=A0ABT3XMG0_9FLAO|nr:hypothetical protein [Chryseobacterium formosus]MCX8523323.1 hypothetical protein [Chryseobacterium formosus]